jgi:hypothetical protein
MISDPPMLNVIFRRDNIMTDAQLTTNLAAWWSAPMIASLVLLGVVAWLAY